MKIAIDISQIVYPGTGVGKYVRNLGEHLVANSDEDFIFFGSSLRKYSELENFLRSIKTNNVHSKLLHIPPKLLSILWNDMHKFPVENFVGKVDIFHSSDWTAPPTRAINITTIYDMIVYKYPQTSDPDIVSTQKKRLHWVKKEANMIIAISQSTKKDIIDILDIPEEKIHVIYPGRDEKFVKKSLTEIDRVKKKYNIKADYILSVGTLEPRKNISRVISAFEYLQKYIYKNQGSTPELVVAGKTGWGDNISSSNKSVKLLGFVKENDLPSLYSGALFFIYPSLYEGFGYPVIEAMSCGTSVITTNRGSLKEVAGEAALFVDPNDEIDIGRKMIELLDIEKRRRLVDQGFNQVKKFSWKISAQKIVDIYKQAKR